MQTKGALSRHLVLVGAGNANLQFVRRFGMDRLPGVQVTLVNDGESVAYSGMVPACVAGEVSADEVSIDLVRLAAWAGVRLVNDRAARLDPRKQELGFASTRPGLRYDAISLNLGSVPDVPPLATGSPRSLPMRPLAQLLDAVSELARAGEATGAMPSIAIVGGGASGCELALALRRRLGATARLTLIHSGARLMPALPASCAHLFDGKLRERGVELRLGARAVAGVPGGLRLSDGNTVVCDAVVWATRGKPPPWLADTGLALRDGFLRVGETLQTVVAPAVFGTGDCVAFDAFPELPRNGVHAVRQGELLYDNIRRFFAGQPLLRFSPQKRTLALLNTADGKAVAAWGGLGASGRALRRWKERIDRRWMRMFTEPGSMTTPAAAPSGDSMRCGGCGAKIPSSVLHEVLAELELPSRPDIVVGCRDAEDAAVVRSQPGKLLVQSVDHFREFIDDCYRFGRIAAVHALSDLFAMNATPSTALAIVTLPEASLGLQRGWLRELMQGALDVFAAHGVVLTGGHTTEAAELSLGFSVTGHADEGGLFRKRAVRDGDVLVLTKPLGTGALLAGRAPGLADGRSIEGALRMMEQSNAAAARELARAGVKACTDITGFGLVGHLVEMLSGSGLGARLDAAAIPVLPGFREAVARGARSTLHEQNAAFAEKLATAKAPPAELFDPQTSGGLLAAVSPDRVDGLLQGLRAAGYPAAARIGVIESSKDDARPIRL